MLPEKCTFRAKQFMIYVVMFKRWSEAESFTIFENHVYTSKKNLTFAINFVHLALKLTQHVIAIGFLSTRLTFAINFVHLALNLMQHVLIAIA